MEEGNNTDVINAIGHIAKAIGMTKIAEETGLSRPSSYKALSDSKTSIWDNYESIESNLRTNSSEPNVCLNK